MNMNGKMRNRKGQRSRRNYFLLRDEQGHGGGGGTTQAPAGDNQGGNQGGGESQGQGESNNSGQGFDFNQFWNDPQSQTQGQNGNQGQNGGELQGQNGQSQNGNGSNESQNFGQQLAQRIDGLNFGDVFTAELGEQIADGNFEGINKQMASMGRESIRQSVALAAHVMQQYGQNIMQMVEAKIAESHGSRDDDSALMKEFPSAAADPALKPMIKNVFDQSMKHSGGNRQKAIELTRDMLKLIGNKGGQDFGIAPNNGSDNFNFNEQASKSLVEDLLGRS